LAGSLDKGCRIETFAYVAAVEPVELRDVENRTADRDVLQLEAPDDGVEIHQLVLAFVRCVGKQTEEGHQRFGQISHRAIEEDARGVLAFAELALVRISQER